MLAIPSPDVVVNLLASMGQVLAVLTLLVGGAAASMRKSEKTRTLASRRWLWATGSIAVVGWIFLLLFWMHVEDAHNRRLRANLLRSSTEAGRAVGDTSLKTLTFSKQLQHPLGIATGDLRVALAKGTRFNLIDVRETEEAEGGRIAGSRHVRYPDLKRDRNGLVSDGADTVLLCYSGNRSSELAEEFQKQGIPCRFMVGGYEKWIAEGGTLDLADGGAREELRQLPDFPNKEVLLDTPDVLAALEEPSTVFVDVRYPEDFERGHLPGAINLPVRMLCGDELARRLAALPKGQVIVPCYDKRSSFYGLILGVKLHREGRRFLGRYTVPHEFPTTGASRPHVAAWKAQNAGVTPFGIVESWLASALRWLQDNCGSLALAILLLVVVVRGALLPLSWKVDVDQWRRKLLGPRIKELRERFASDPTRAQRGVLQLYRRAGLTPGRNLFVSIGQLLLFLAFFAVVQDVAANSTESVSIWQLGAPDAYGILPILVGLLMAAILCNGPVGRAKLVLAGVVAVGLGALTWTLGAAANIYLVLSLVWVFAQGRLAFARVRREQDEDETDLSLRGVVTLEEAARSAGAGNKAIRLGRMKAAGLPVPDGLAITDHALESARQFGQLTAADRRKVHKLHRRLRAERVAVRSSGLKEDGGDKSYAGVYESVLDVTASGLFDAVDFVRESMISDRARAYGDGEVDERGGIVIQSMVPAEYAGVMFTEHPGTSGTTLVELVEGLCEQLVGGSVTPKAFAFTRVTGRLIDETEPPIDLAPLLQLGHKVEELFGAPQDIEWAYADGRFYLLQARDITVLSGSGSSPQALREAERARLLAVASDAEAEQVVFAQNELSELLPDPTPFSASFMKSLWAPGGSVDLACRSLGIGYDVTDEDPEFVNEVFGRIYVNKREERRRLAKGMGAMASFRLTRGGDAMENEYRTEFLPNYHRRMRLIEACDLGRLSNAGLFDLWRDLRQDFVTNTYVEAERINIAADFFVKSATEQLRKHGLDPASALAKIPTTVVHRAMAMLPGIKTGTVKTASFVDLFGHRARHDFEFGEARYAEDHRAIDELATHAHSSNGSHDEADEQGYGRVLRHCLDRARRFQALKEEAKHEATRQLAMLRAVTLEIGRRHGVADRIFWLRPDEVEALEQQGVGANLHDLIEEREHVAESFAEMRLPVRLTLADLESLTFDDGPVIGRDFGEGALTGMRVAGGEDVVGRVRVLRDAAEIKDFKPGEILVARFTDPTWSAVFPIAGGLITEVGGWLSHAAIQAREYGLACIVDVAGAADMLETGDMVRLGVDGTVECLEQVEAAPEAQILNFPDGRLGKGGAADTKVSG